jgi:hypothetical protein
MSAVRKTLLASVSLLTVLALLAACGPTPEPVQVEKIITQVVEVQETVQVEVEKVVEKVVTPTAPPARDVIIVAMTFAPDTLDPADHRSRSS